MVVDRLLKCNRVKQEQYRHIKRKKKADSVPKAGTIVNIPVPREASPGGTILHAVGDCRFTALIPLDATPGQSHYFYKVDKASVSSVEKLVQLTEDEFAEV